MGDAGLFPKNRVLRVTYAKLALHRFRVWVAGSALKACPCTSRQGPVSAHELAHEVTARASNMRQPCPETHRCFGGLCLTRIPFLRRICRELCQMLMQDICPKKSGPAQALGLRASYMRRGPMSSTSEITSCSRESGLASVGGSDPETFTQRC